METKRKNQDKSSVPISLPGKTEFPDTSLPSLLMDHISDGAVLIDAGFTILSCNKTACLLYGLDEAAMVGQHFTSLFTYDYSPVSFDDVLSTAFQSVSWSGDVTWKRLDGSKILLGVSFLPYRNEANEVSGFMVISRQAEPSAAFSRMMETQPLFDALAEGMVVQNRDADILVCNSAAARICGVSREQICERGFLKENYRFVDENGAPIAYETIPGMDSFQTKTPNSNVVVGMYRPDDSLVWLNVNSFPILQETTGEVVTVVTSFTDITDIRVAKEQLKRTEENWVSVLDISKIGIFMVDEEYRLLLINEQGRRILQLLVDTDVLTEHASLIDLLPENRKGPVKELLAKAISGERVEYEIVYTKENNTEIWFLLNYAPVKTPDGRVSSVCITASNITEIKKNESELIKSEQRWKFALDGAGDGVWEYNFQTKESYYSPLYKTMLGFAENEFLNEAFEWQTRVHPEDLPKIRQIDVSYENGTIENHSIEYRLKGKSGDYVWVLDRGMILARSADGKPLKLIGTHKNITGRKLSEEKLFKSQHLFSSFMSNTPTMTWIIDEHDVFRYLNASYLASFGLSENAIGQSIYNIFPKSICDVFVENNWKVWDSGRPIETIEEGLGPDGSYQLYHIFKFPLDNEDGTRLLGGVALDITQKSLLEKKLADEQEKKKREIIQAIINAQEAERHELAAELHDNVNQILSSTKLMLEVAVEKPEIGNEFTTRGLHYLQDAINEIRKISHNLIPATLKDISLEAAIEEVIRNIHATGKLKIIYSKNFQEDEESINPEIQLSILRVIQEQFNNILKHAEASEAFFSLLIDKHTIHISIQDNGRGFDTVATKRGIGLNSIFNRVEYYHGEVKLTSFTGEGCMLQIEIPVKN